MTHVEYQRKFRDKRPEKVVKRFKNKLIKITKKDSGLMQNYCWIIKNIFAEADKKLQPSFTEKQGKAVSEVGG
jgi:hypothetical protein